MVHSTMGSTEHVFEQFGALYMHNHDISAPTRIRIWYLQVTSPSRYEWAFMAGQHFVELLPQTIYQFQWYMYHNMGAYIWRQICNIRQNVIRHKTSPVRLLNQIRPRDTNLGRFEITYYIPIRRGSILIESSLSAML